MKKLLSILLAALSFCANAATTLPVQLINPTGSTSGQTIVSTGASSAPAWGNVGVGSIGSITANTVVANATGSSASPTAVTVTGCNGAAQALQWTNGSGFGCNSAVATSGANSNITSLSGLTGAITPAYPAGIIGNVSGVAKNSTAIGYVNTSSSSAVAIATGVPTNCASVALPAGDWDIQGTLSANPAGTTGISQIVAGVSLTSATFATVNTGATAALALGFTVGTVQIVPTPVYHVSTSSAGTAYLVGQISYGTSTLTCSGFISITRR